jgi:hypothetical protein
LAVLLVAVVLVLVLAGSGGGDPTGCINGVCGDNPPGEQSKWPNGDAQTLSCADVNSGNYSDDYDQGSLNAAIQYCSTNPGQFVNVELSN